MNYVCPLQTTDSKDVIALLGEVSSIVAMRPVLGEGQLGPSDSNADRAHSIVDAAA